VTTVGQVEASSSPGRVEMKPAVVVCAVALVLVLTTAPSAAPQGASSSSGTGLGFVTNRCRALGDECRSAVRERTKNAVRAAFEDRGILL
jgi:hypothetical protein